MTHRERFIATVLGEPVDRPPYILFWGPWGTTLERWKREGLGGNPSKWRAQFNSDPTPKIVPVNCGPCPARKWELIEEDEDSAVFLDTWGVKRRNFKHKESMSEFIEFPVKSRDDWETYKARWLDPDHPDRIAGAWRETCRAWMDKDLPIQLGGFPDTGLFGGLRWLLGDEKCLMAFCTMPDLVHDIMDHLTTLYLTVFEAVAKEARIDVIHLWEDMCGRQGPLIGPELWEKFMAPGYRRIKDFAERHGIPLMSVDTDGDPDLITPPMMRAGVNYLYPMEVAAGCDVKAWRRKYPGLGMMGGIDKRTLALSPEAIDAELERVRPVIESGGYIADLDHLVPDDVSWQNYCYYARRLKEVVGAD